jgi:hypothetical protein
MISQRVLMAPASCLIGASAILIELGLREHLECLGVGWSSGDKGTMERDRK